MFRAPHTNGINFPTNRFTAAACAFGEKSWQTSDNLGCRNLTCWQKSIINVCIILWRIVCHELYLASLGFPVLSVLLLKVIPDGIDSRNPKKVCEKEREREREREREKEKISRRKGVKNCVNYRHIWRSRRTFAPKDEGAFWFLTMRGDEKNMSPKFR
jgi:hypothetical protein